MSSIFIFSLRCFSKLQTADVFTAELKMPLLMFVSLCCDVGVLCSISCDGWRRTSVFFLNPCLGSVTVHVSHPSSLLFHRLP